MTKEGEVSGAAPMPAISFMDNPLAPEVFATAATGFLVNAGNVHITFEAMRVNHVTSPGPVNRVVIGRVVMPLIAAQGLLVGLYDILKKQGYDPLSAPQQQTMQ
jgi:hypothetical protein